MFLGNSTSVFILRWWSCGSHIEQCHSSIARCLHLFVVWEINSLRATFVLPLPTLLLRITGWMAGSRKNNWRTMPSLAYGGWHNSGSYSLWYVTYTVSQFLLSAALCVLRWAPHFAGAGGDGDGHNRSRSSASFFCSSWLNRFSNTRLSWWDMLANLCLLLMSVCCSFEWWKRAVCNVWYRCLDQLIQTACLKLLWKICNSITLSSMKASAIGSLSFMYLEVCTCSSILFPAVGRTWKNCHRKTIVTTNFFVALLWCGRHINNTVFWASSFIT